MERRRPSRSIRWSSASIRRMPAFGEADGGALVAPTGVGPIDSCNVMSCPLQETTDSGTSTLSGNDVERGADARCPFPHSDDPVAVEAARGSLGEPHAVVQHFEG